MRKILFPFLLLLTPLVQSQQSLPVIPAPARLDMRDGRFVEEGANPAIWEAPRHAYTQSLMAAMPRVRWRVAVGNQSAAVTPPST